MWLGILDGLLKRKCPDWHKGLEDKEDEDGNLYLKLLTHSGKTISLILTKKEMEEFETNFYLFCEGKRKLFQEMIRCHLIYH